MKKDNTWKSDLEHMLDSVVEDTGSLAGKISVKATVIKQQLIAQGYSSKQAGQMIEKEVRKLLRERGMNA